MNRYGLTQLLSIISCLSAAIFWWFFPNINVHADTVVEYTLSILQAAIIPNAFFSLLTAIVTLSRQKLKTLAGCFIQSMFVLWGVVISTLFVLWWGISASSASVSILPTFSYERIWITALVPIMMLSAIILGSIISSSRSLKRYIPYICSIQRYVSLVFEYIFLLIPILIFFVMMKFLGLASFEHSKMAFNYFLLAIVFVGLISTVIFPLLFRYILNVPYAQYTQLVAPVALMTFLAGDSIAAIPLIARAVDIEEGDSNTQISRIITLVVICFPWVGELANLLFPIYSATLEGMGVSTVLSILSVGPFFMFTDPYISIPTLLSVYDFPEIYRITYLTLALLTDHMFEVCEAIAVLFVVIRLRHALSPQNTKLLK